MTEVRFRLGGNLGAGIQALMPPGGPIADNIWRRGIRVMTKARENLAGPPKRIDTGRLRSSISIGESEEVPGGVRVGTDVEYAAFVHDGTIYMEANPFLVNALEAVPE